MDFAPEDPPPPAPESPASVVVGSRPCLSCGYDLQGLSIEGLCPECGATVARSLKGNLLEFASPEYLRTLNLGAVLIIWGAFAPLLAGGLTLGTKLLTESGHLSAFVTGRGSEIIPAALSMAGASVSLFGWFLFTRPDPGQIGADGGEKARRWVRIMLIAEVAVNLAGLVSAFIPSLAAAIAAQGTPAGNGSTGIPLAMIILGIAFVVLKFAVSAARAAMGAWYVYTLASRVPDLSLRKFAKTMIWLFPVLMTAGYVVCGLGPLSAWIISIVIASKCRKGVRAARERASHAEWSANFAVPPGSLTTNQ